MNLIRKLLYKIPVDWRLSDRFEKRISLREWFRAEETCDRKRRRMSRLDYAMLFLVNETLLFLRKITPEKERTAIVLLRNHFDHAIGEMIPADLGMRGGLVCLDREKSVEHEDSFVGPFLQASAETFVAFKRGNVVLEFGENVSQRRRQCYAFRDRE